jgi:hypothetical protein
MRDCIRINGRLLRLYGHRYSDLRYYRGLNTRNIPTVSEYYRCNSNWKLAQWLCRMYNRKSSF